MVFISALVLSLIQDGLVILLAFAVIASTVLSLYLLLLAVASLRSTRRSSGRGEPTTRFAILIPAYEEELVIGRLLVSINEIDYPRELFEVHVIADHCSDQTAAIARSLGATVHDRGGPDPRGKSRSLQWLVQHLLQGESGQSIDAFVVFDADSTISSNFLRTMDLEVRAGKPFIQGLIQIEDPGADRIGQLRALAYEFISNLRPLGRSALGLSVGLRGNGMCIARDCAAQFAWDSDSLAEDYELHGRLLAAGLRVSFAPEAVVHTQLPHSLAAARTQSARWERGRLDAMRRHAPALLAQGIKRHAWASIDGAIELLTPPFSIFAVLMLALFALSVLSGIPALIVTATLGLIAQGLYTLRGLALASTRYPNIYRALLLVPAFVAWRLGSYLAVLVRRRPVQWTRTERAPAKQNTHRRILGSRICIIRHYYYPEDPRGRREAEALAEAGHHVDVLALRNAGEPATEVINGVHVRRLPVKHYRGSLFHYAYEYGAFFLLSCLVLTWRFIRHRYDVVQVNSLPDFLVFAGLPCKLFRARLVLDMHECTPELYCTKYSVTPDHPIVRVLAWIEQRSLAFADQVITCTPQQRSVFASRGTPPGKIAVVLNAANSAVFRPRTCEPELWQPGGRFELVAHGLIVQRYGLDTMVQAVALLEQEIPGIVLHVYGKGDYLPEMQALACRLGVADRVVAHGFVPEEELLEGIARAHVGVVAAKRDSFRNLTHTQKMYEYVAMHKPVVIAETPAIRTHFDDSCFQFFASDDAEDLARALCELYHNPTRALEMVESSSRRYRAYAWEAQRHVYCDAVLGTAPQYVPGRVTVQDRAAHSASADLVPVPVKVEVIPAVSFRERVSEVYPTILASIAVEATPAAPSMDLGGMTVPEAESAGAVMGGIYLSGMTTPESEVGI
jgi:glycosyltransferase involved in cell wall biosynthesis/cellulose synthase/poly-beta-1,6-N-acetylglucosamine synthase-like glycosyltransferase